MNDGLYHNAKIKKAILVSMILRSRNGKESIIEYLRVLSTLAVVANHVCSGLFNNYSIEQMGNYNEASSECVSR